MARLYADEQFPRVAVECLQNLGHDVLTIQAAGNTGATDPEVLAYAIRTERAVITHNRRDFIRLHRLQPQHFGIVVCSEDQNFVKLAERIHQAILKSESLKGQLIRVIRPST